MTNRKEAVLYKVFRILFDSGFVWYSHTSDAIDAAAEAIVAERGFYGAYKVEQVDEFHTADRAAAAVKRAVQKIKWLKELIIEVRLRAWEEPPCSIRALRG